MTLKKRNEIILIVAMGKQRQIGLNGNMPWHLSDDLKNFKKLTSEHIIIMGRKTFSSIGKALPKRLNFVLTSQPKNVQTYDVCLHDNINNAIKKASLFDDKIFIIGGSSLYKQTLNLADKLIITHVDYNGKADTFFPEIDWNKWKVDENKKFFKNEKNDYNFEIITYVKKQH